MIETITTFLAQTRPSSGRGYPVIPGPVLALLASIVLVGVPGLISGRAASSIVASIRDGKRVFSGAWTVMLVFGTVCVTIAWAILQAVLLRVVDALEIPYP